MDDIINKFENLLNEEDQIDSLIDSIRKVDLHDPCMEEKRLIDNYSKLKYLKQIVNSFKNQPDDKYKMFMKPFNMFMDKIDSVNRYYLDKVILDPGYYNNQYLENFNNSDICSLRDIVTIVGHSLNDSLNEKNTITKLDLVLNAYSNIIKVIESVNKESISEVLDPSFESQFNYKRRKMN